MKLYYTLYWLAVIYVLFSELKKIDEVENDTFKDYLLIIFKSLFLSPFIAVLDIYKYSKNNKNG